MSTISLWQRYFKRDSDVQRHWWCDSTRCLSLFWHYGRATNLSTAEVLNAQAFSSAIFLITDVRGHAFATLVLSPYGDVFFELRCHSCTLECSLAAVVMMNLEFDGPNNQQFEMRACFLDWSSTFGRKGMSPQLTLVQPVRKGPCEPRGQLRCLHIQLVRMSQYCTHCRMRMELEFRFSFSEEWKMIR